jgi:hypothetical protein
MRTCILICVVCILACPQADARWLNGARALTGSPGAPVSGIVEARSQTATWIGPTTARSVLAILESLLLRRYHYVTPGIPLAGQHPVSPRYHYVTPGVSLTGQHPVPRRYHYVTPGVSLTGQHPGFGLERSHAGRS